MKKYLLGVCVAALGVTSASAADMATKAPSIAAVASRAVYDWTGFYIGANGSYNWQTAGFPDKDVGDMKATGAMGGLTLGADYQINSVVIGVIGDVDFGNVGVTVKNGNFMTESANEKLFATVRGRVGYLVAPQLLVYGTAGVAIASLDQNESCPTGVEFGFCSMQKNKAGPYSLTGNQTMVGGVYGAGVEWMFAHNWSTKVEYLYSNLGSANFNLGAAPSGVTTTPRDISFTQQQVRLGVNYKFGGQ
jgi:outer membrane immunogenic protein